MRIRDSSYRHQISTCGEDQEDLQSKEGIGNQNFQPEDRLHNSLWRFHESRKEQRKVDDEKS